MNEAILKLKELKNQSGTHSPSIKNIIEEIPEVSISIDACFLSNPYATNLFFEYFEKEVIVENQLRDMLEFYPTQNQSIARVLGNYLGVNHSKILIGNGAEEIIERYINEFVKKGAVMPIPTFSPYYEYLRDDVKFLPYKLDESSDFRLNIEDFVAFVNRNFSEIDTIVLINPNNPNGGFVDLSGIEMILKRTKGIENVILDQSFLHFTDMGDSLDKDLALLTESYPNLVIIKSMSKDFGIAGIRAGYGIMNTHRRNALLSRGMLWNSNGIAEYFYRLFVKEDFQERYVIERSRYNEITKKFFKSLLTIEGIKVISGNANFFLVDTRERNNFEVFAKLITQFGIYTRVCDDKIGLREGKYLRIASRTEIENFAIIEALKSIYNE